MNWRDTGESGWIIQSFQWDIDRLRIGWGYAIDEFFSSIFTF